MIFNQQSTLGNLSFDVPGWVSPESGGGGGGGGVGFIFEDSGSGGGGYFDPYSVFDADVVQKFNSTNVVSNAANDQTGGASQNQMPNDLNKQLIAGVDNKYLAIGALILGVLILR